LFFFYIKTKKLEVGQVAVASFGESVRVVHPFEASLSDEAGGEILRRFSFNQTSTNVLQLMRDSIGILSRARDASSSSGKDLWQLEIIISDGILEDHKSVRHYVRQAAHCQIMTVFIILDRRQERDSIMRMTNVSYEANAKDGMSLKMTPYMETFPFDYFIVLRVVEDLPNVLAETLRQYLMLVGA
jgi:midasin